MAVKPVQKAKKTKKQRKFGRSAKYCLYYKLSHRCEHNKVRRLRKHLLRFPDDKCAAKAVEVCLVVIRGY